MKYPNRAQWVVIWLGFILTATLWTSGWDTGYHTDRVTFAFVVGTILAVWALSGMRTKALPNSATPFQRTITLALRQGAPPLPWGPEDIDRKAARAFAAFFTSSGASATVQEGVGQFGPSLEIQMRGAPPNTDPLIIISRTWNPDTKQLNSLLIAAGVAPPDLELLLTEYKFNRLGPPGMPFGTYYRE